MTTGRDTLTGSTSDTARVAAPREAMVAELGKLNAIRGDQVAAAFRAVCPDTLIAPGEPAERAYTAKTIPHTKFDERGVAVSMVSAPDIQAMMLEQAPLGRGRGSWRSDRRSFGQLDLSE